MENKKVIAEKITALLRKTELNGASESEAISAFALAQKLMGKHGLTMEDIVSKSEASIDFSYKRAGTAASAFTIADTILLHPIGKFTDTKPCLVVQKKDADEGEVFFFGYSVDVDLAIYILEICKRALTAEWLKYKSRFSLKTENLEFIRVNFQTGMALRLKDRLSRLTEKTTGTDLVVLKNALVEAAFAQAKNENSFETRMLTKVDESIPAFHAGVKAADGVRFFREFSRETAMELLEETTNDGVA